MNKTTILLILASAWMGAIASAAEAAADNMATPPPPAEAAPPAPPQDTPPAESATTDTNSVLAAVPAENGTNGLRLNFRSAPLNLVLDYLSDAAGFIINKEAEVRGSVDVWSTDPVSKEEAIELLNSVLRKNGYAVLRNGRILTIVSLDSAKTSDLEIQQGYKWEEVEKSDEVITQIIPVRYANATQLMNNLQVLLPTTATLAVNESANSLILVATKTDIRRMLRIVNALDTSIASVASIKVFPLKYADAKQLATVIQQVFTTQASGQGMNPRAQLFNMFGGGRFGGPGGPGGPGGGGSGSSGGGSKVTAAADEYSNSLIISASSEMMATITDMVEQIDQPASDVTEVRVFRLTNADPTELADQIAQLFPDETRSGTSSGRGGGGFRFFGGPRGFGGASSQSGSSDRMMKKGKVIAVPDPRTSSILVSAASELMPQLAEMIERLDGNTGKKEVVRVFDLQNANITDVNQILQDLFNRNNTMRSSSSSSRSMLGQGNPLLQRQTQQQNTGSRTSGFGTTSGRSGGSTFGGGF